MFLLPSLVGCFGYQKLKEGEYNFMNKTEDYFVIVITDDDLNPGDISEARVKLKYGYIEYIRDEAGEVIDTTYKTETETFTMYRNKFESKHMFSGGFKVGREVTDFECKKVEVYYSGNSSNSYGVMSVSDAILVSFGCIIFGLIIWFILSLIFPYEKVLGVVVIPFVIGVLGCLLAGDLLQALIFFIAGGVYCGLAGVIVSKFKN